MQRNQSGLKIQSDSINGLSALLKAVIHKNIFDNNTVLYNLIRVGNGISHFCKAVGLVLLKECQILLDQVVANFPENTHFQQPRLPHH